MFKEKFRGKKLFADLTANIGPDAEYNLHGHRVVVDFTGISDALDRYRHLFQARRCTHSSQLQQSLAEATLAEADFTPVRSFNPVEIRERSKRISEVGQLCTNRGLEFIPLVYVNSGGYGKEFDQFLITAFGQNDDMVPGEFGRGIHSTLQYCRQVLTATIANAFAEEVVTNMRQAFRRRGRASTEIAWWHADRATGSFQRDTLDDALIQSTEGELIDSHVQQSADNDSVV